ncbi:hypothetical protein [Corynebacterium sp. ACRQJ]|uniref:hypothetical protein n=1 Tax=Corynebacterium sp. ACRQJ TaxID=2918189 RepID=UPI001EF3E00F|nr:hypothetical protein [Corynebacterium sp. ACRQJ]MCG7266985.1 hypothetical protein [Corynebacterium sp. ACRQJ]
MYGRPQDVVVWVNPRTQRGKQLGGLAIGLVFAALAVGCVAMMVVEKTLIPLVALALVGLAMFGWYTSQRQANARATSSTTINPALVVDDSGVGDAAIRIPWSDIARVNVISTRYQSAGPESVGLGPELADQWTRSAGVLDGEFALQVVLRPGSPGRPGVPTQSALDVYRIQSVQVEAAVLSLPRGIYEVDAIGVTFKLGSAVPMAWRDGLTQQIADNVRFHGVDFGPAPA